MQIQNILAQTPHEASVASPRIRSLGQLTMGSPWRLEVQHARASHLFLWLTKGQGRATILGKRRGVGAHNALFVAENAWYPSACGVGTFTGDIVNVHRLPLSANGTPSRASWSRICPCASASSCRVSSPRLS